MLEIKNLSKSYNKKIVLDDVSYEFLESKITGIYGESGIGKSTIANILVGLTKPDSGEILLDGNYVYKDNKYQKEMHKKIHLIPQHPLLTLDPAIKLKTQIHELCRVHKLFDSKKDEEEAISNLLISLGLERGILERYSSQISGGEGQRIAILEALLLKPRVIISDESLSMLDSITQAQIIEIYQKIVKEYGVIFIMISHDLDCLKKICNKIYEVRK